MTASPSFASLCHHSTSYPPMWSYYLKCQHFAVITLRLSQHTNTLTDYSVRRRKFDWSSSPFKPHLHITYLNPVRCTCCRKNIYFPFVCRNCNSSKGTELCGSMRILETFSSIKKRNRYLLKKKNGCCWRCVTLFIKASQSCMGTKQERRATCEAFDRAETLRQSKDLFPTAPVSFTWRRPPQQKLLIAPTRATRAGTRGPPFCGALHYVLLQREAPTSLPRQ